MANKLRELRMEIGTTQIELSAITGISRYKLQCAEAGYAVLKETEIKILAKVFGYKFVPEFLNAICLSSSEVKSGKA